jgi:hypothetical protein
MKDIHCLTTLALLTKNDVPKQANKYITFIAKDENGIEHEVIAQSYNIDGEDLHFVFRRSVHTLAALFAAHQADGKDYGAKEIMSFVEALK